MPEDEFKKRKKKADDCGCNAAHGDEDEFGAGVMPFDKGADTLAPDPRGTTVRRWSGLIAPYNLPTGDGRRFADGALSSRELPLPVKWQRTDSQGHSTSVTVGRIDGVNYTEAGVDAWGIIFDPDATKYARLKEDADEAYFLLQQKTIGPSVDLDDMEFHPLGDPSEMSADARQEIEVTRGRISAITLVQIPAFSEARPFALDDLDADEYAEMTAVTAAGVAQGMDSLPVAADVHDLVALLASIGTDPGSVAYLYDTPERQLFPVARIEAGALSLVPGMVADAVGVLAYHGADVDLPDGVQQAMRAQLEALTAACGLPNPPWAQAALVASAAPTASRPVRWWEDPKLDGPTPLTVTEDGRVYGHVATWGTCHIGFPGSCVTPPRSRSKYAYFHQGHADTDAGRIRAGKITLGGGHADTRLGFQAAAEHYDSTSAAVADVRAGEDVYGIWVAGAVRMDVDARRVAELAAAPLSGDWRRINGGMELVAALAVNTPGFPIPHVKQRGQDTYALVAAAVVPRDPRADKARRFAGIFEAESAELATVSRRERALTAGAAFR